MRFTVEEEQAVLDRSGVLPMLPAGALDELRKRYSEPHRHYHVWDHALQVLSWVNHISEDSGVSVITPAGADGAMKLAALFHDAVYDPLKKSPLNEAASLELMRSFGIKNEEAEDIIMATARHGKTRPGDLPYHIELFLDCDIMHFGEKRWEIVCWNEGNVAREYEQHYTKAQVADGRQKFLEDFTANKRPIFMTSYFRGMFEDQARANLDRLIRETPIATGL